MFVLKDIEIIESIYWIEKRKIPVYGITSTSPDLYLTVMICCVLFGVMDGVIHSLFVN